jgi:hypothetical protein
MSDQPHTPSAIDLAKNLVNQAVAITQDVLHNRPVMAHPVIAIQRLRMCQTCEFYEQPKCTQCGCNMPLKTKIMSASCPTKKW